MTFEDLNLTRPILNALEDASYTEPTPIQAKTLPVVMSGRDVVGIAQTGTGKTIAYVLPILRMLPYSVKLHPRVLIIVPTRELVVQVVEDIKMLTTYMSVRIAGVYGGVNMSRHRELVEPGQDIIVATPGRLLDLVLCGSIRLKDIQKLVIDEVDEMLNTGFRTQLKNILDLLPERRQNMMFSATITEEVEKIIEAFFNNPKWIEIERTGTPLEKIRQHAYMVSNFNTKVNLLEHILADKEQYNKVLVFADDKKEANLLFERMLALYPEEIDVIHSNKTQNYRLNAVDTFRDGSIRVLVATDIIARGLDVREVSHVINFSLPEAPEQYMHRIGRTGRADAEGIAINFVNYKDQNFQQAIENLMGREIPMHEFPEEVEISEELIPEEMPKRVEVDYMKDIKRAGASTGGFQEKKKKNAKKNLGGPGKRNPKKTKPVNRGRLKQKSKKKK